jgi:phosphoglycerate dehydrogenase-like enzyme
VIATRVVGCLTDAVADHTFALLFAVARRIVEGDAQIRAGGWQPLQGVAVFGKTLGLVGFGPIGQAVADRAQGFQMRVLVHDPYQPNEVLAQHGAERTPLPELLSASDFVSIHTALTPETYQIVDADGLARMQPHAILLNTARGKMVDQQALHEALADGRIRGAGLDSYDPDPLPGDHPFRQAPNCVLMPHSAFNTDASARAVSKMAADAVLAVKDGRAPEHILNPEVLDSPNLRAKLR